MQETTSTSSEPYDEIRVVRSKNGVLGVNLSPQKTGLRPGDLVELETYSTGQSDALVTKGWANVTRASSTSVRISLSSPSPFREGDRIRVRVRKLLRG